MEWYRFNPETGEYTNKVQCQKNPKGGYLIPANATPIKPPATGSNKAVVFRDEQWQFIEDHRGKTVYSKVDKIGLEIKDLGPIPKTHTEQKPDHYDDWDEGKNQWVHNSEREQQDKVDAERNWASNELALSDRCLLEDFPIDSEGREQILEYRQLLRNPERTDSPAFPEAEWRPVWPENVKRPAV